MTREMKSALAKLGMFLLNSFYVHAHRHEAGRTWRERWESSGTSGDHSNDH